MATTSLWAVRGTIRDVVAYVKDPNKTANPDYDLKNVLTYAADSSKTEKQYYVTGLNCSPHFAFERMTATKERYGKRGGIVGYHGYQSFKPGELTPEECHKIGVLTAKRMWGDRFEVIVATHVKGSSALHNHFVINSVSFKDGKKYRWQKGSYRQLRRVSDELCRQHQLSIIENPMPKKVPRQIWIAEKQGKVTHVSILRHDIDRAIRSNISFKYFLQALEYLGYVVVRDSKYKHLSVITEGWSKPVRIDSLGANYTLEAIDRRIRDNLHKEPVPHIRKPQRRVACELEKQMKALERYSTIEILFMIFFELMGIPYDDPFTKEQRMPPKYEIASPYFAQEAINNDRYCREIRLMSWYELHTAEDVTVFRDKRKAELQNLERERKAVDNRRRRLTDPDEKQKNSAERSAITQKMTNVRREMNLADDILSDSIRLAKAIAAEKACEERLVPDRSKQNHKEQER